MDKKNSKNVLGSLVICSILLLSTIAISAGSTEAVFGAGESTATARLAATDAFVEASTTPSNIYWNSASVQCRALYGSGNATGWDYGRYDYAAYWAIADAPTLCYAGESIHTIDGISKYLSCSYS